MGLRKGNGKPTLALRLLKVAPEGFDKRARPLTTYLRLSCHGKQRPQVASKPRCEIPRSLTSQSPLTIGSSGHSPLRRIPVALLGASPLHFALSLRTYLSMTSSTPQPPLTFDSAISYSPTAGGDVQAVTPNEGAALQQLTPTGMGKFTASIRRQRRLYADWHPDIKAFAQAQAAVVVLPPFSLNAWDRQMTNLLAYHPKLAFNRAQLGQIKAAFIDVCRSLPSDRTKPTLLPGDVIQDVNKSGQWGLKHQSHRVGRDHFYTLRLPFSSVPGNRAQQERARRAGESGHLTDQEKALQRQATLDFLTTNFFDVPVEKWDVGHANGTASSILVAQPGPYQRSRRDGWMFDDKGLVKAPRLPYLTENLDEFYTEEEQLELLRTLRHRFPWEA